MSYVLLWLVDYGMLVPHGFGSYNPRDQKKWVGGELFPVQQGYMDKHYKPAFEKTMIYPGFLYVRSLFLGASQLVRRRRKRELLDCPHISLIGNIGRAFCTVPEFTDGGRQGRGALFTDGIVNLERKNQHGLPYVSLQECLGTPHGRALLADMTFKDILDYEIT